MITWSKPFRARLSTSKCVICKHRIWRKENALTTLNTKRPWFAHLKCAVNEATGRKS